MSTSTSTSMTKTAPLGKAPMHGLKVKAGIKAGGLTAQHNHGVRQV